MADVNVVSAANGESAKGGENAGAEGSYGAADHNVVDDEVGD